MKLTLLVLRLMIWLIGIAIKAKFIFDVENLF